MRSMLRIYKIIPIGEFYKLFFNAPQWKKVQSLQDASQCVMDSSKVEEGNPCMLK